MKKDGIDWSVIKGSIIILCISIIFCSAIIAASYYFNKQEEKKFNTNKRLFQSISRQYLDIDQEEKLLLDYYPKFIELYNEGYIGNEKRLNWIEALRQSGENVDIPSLTYSITSQSEFSPNFPVNYNGYKLYSSRMTLSLGLLHERDLFSLLKELNKYADGSFTTNSCQFTLNGRQILFEKDHTNISASCVLEWITLNLPDGKNIEI